jgi:hypothetical protein
LELIVQQFRERSNEMENPQELNGNMFK